MSDNINETYKGVPLKKYEGKISDLGYKSEASEAEAIEYAMKIFNDRVRKSNIRILGHDIDFPK